MWLKDKGVERMEKAGEWMEVATKSINDMNAIEYNYSFFKKW